MGFYTDIDCRESKINLAKRFWNVPWEIKYSIFILLTNRKMTIDDLTQENLDYLSKIVDCDKILEELFLSNEIFSIENFLKLASLKNEEYSLPEGHTSVRKILVSPSCIIFMPHEIDLGNRAIREKDMNYFLRVNFVDEYNERAVWDRCPRVLKRFRKVLKGISLLGRYFEFLGFSNSQMRNHSCWMVNANTEFCGDSLRESFGTFENIKSVCKYASRLGLFFSGTYGTITIDQEKIFEIDDVKKNGYTFSDGIGLISKDLFDSVIKIIHIKEAQKICALQVRIGGCKGVIAVDPNIKTGVYVRKSMNKFFSDHLSLEVCTYASSHPGYLNRQIILLLNGLGISNSTFLTLQREMITQLRQILSSEQSAKTYLKRTFPSYYKDIIYMLDHNLKLSDDEYLRGMINAYYLANIKLIKSKARIYAPNSRLLMGVLDEYGVLEYGEVFVQITDEESSEIIQSSVAIGKNPCYHPGDIRVLNAVDRPELHHLHNVVVFPQKGHRPHPNECSGSDLDGDLYFLTWNPSLVPSDQVEPMDYPAADELIENEPSMAKKVIKFFTTFMASENIGRISNCHLVWADQKGIYSGEALELARLTSVAVDFPKTGKPAELPYSLRISTWPDFMEKKNKPFYESSGVIGLLWRDCKLENFEFNISHVLNKDRLYPGYQKFSTFAKWLYENYANKMKKLMYQFDCDNEFFLISGQVGENSKRKMRYDDSLQILNMVTLNRDYALEKFCEKALNFEDRKKLASACYFEVYSRRPKNRKFLCLSFPWIFHEYLV